MLDLLIDLLLNIIIFFWNHRDTFMRQIAFDDEGLCSLRLIIRSVLESRVLVIKTEREEMGQ